MNTNTDFGMTTYSKPDSIDRLSDDQLELMANTDNHILVLYLETKTHFDAHRVRLLLELGAIEASRRLAAMRQKTSLTGEES